MNINHITQTPYKGKNQDNLEEARAERGYKSPEWLTFVQARQVGRTVKKGEHGTRIGRVSADKEKDGTRKQGHWAGFAVVFNIEQTDVITK